MFRFFICVSVILLSFSSFKSDELIMDEKDYDLPGMIAYFALDAADVATIQKWSFAAGSKSPVKWTDTEPQWDAATSTYTKSGTATIIVEGAPMNFSVILSGTKIVVNRVQLNLTKSASVKVYEIEKMLNAAGIITSYLKCDNPMPKSYGTLAYSVLIPKKKEAWLSYTWQCLKGECSANINIWYEKESVEKLPCY